MKMLLIDEKRNNLEDVFSDLQSCCDALIELRDDLTSEERWEVFGANDAVLRRLYGQGCQLGAVIRHLQEVIEHTTKELPFSLLTQDFPSKEGATNCSAERRFP